jgi:hypothetical protein
MGGKKLAVFATNPPPVYSFCFYHVSYLSSLDLPAAEECHLCLCHTVLRCVELLAVVLVGVGFHAWRWGFRGVVWSRIKIKIETRGTGLEGHEISRDETSKQVWLVCKYR